MKMAMEYDIRTTRRARLKQWIEDNFGGQQARFVDATGINQGELSGLLRDKSFGEKKARGLEKQANMPHLYLDGVDPDEVTTAYATDLIAPSAKKVSEPQESYLAKPYIPLDSLEFMNIPLLSTFAAMGSGSEMMDEEVIIDVLRLSRSWLDRNLVNVSSIKNLSFIHGIGDSMAPTFQDGDILLTDTGIKGVSIDGVYVLEAHSRLFIKRVRQRIDGKHEISSDNPTVKTVDILNGDHEVIVRGRVVWVWNGRRL